MKLAVLITLLPACATDPASNATLADLPDLQIAVQGWMPSDTAPTNGFVTIGYDTATFRSTHDDHCAVLGAFTATYNGARIEHLDPGGDNDDPVDCAPPSLDFDVQFDGPTTFVIADDSLTVTAAFDADAFAPRVPTLLSPATWEFHGGDMVRVGWPVPADFTGLAGQPWVVSFSTGKLENNNAFDLAPVFAGDEIHFTIPSPPPRTGPGFIEIELGYTVGDATTCDGAARCEFSASRGFSHSVVIDP
jgi:hypothetical protein